MRNAALGWLAMAVACARSQGQAPPPPPPPPPDDAVVAVVDPGPPRPSLLDDEIPYQLWPPLPGRQVGLLISGGSRWGSNAGWMRQVYEEGRGAGRTTYLFVVDRQSPRALYFTAKQGEGYNFLPSWEVPLPEGKTARYDAAMHYPGSGSALGLVEQAHLVELEINDGRGTPGTLHFVATEVAVLDGSDDYPIVSARALDDAAARWRAFADAQQGAIDDALRDAGRGEPQVAETFFVTWLEHDARLRAVFYRRVARTTRTEREVTGHCPPGAPCARDVEVTIRGEAVELALIVEYDVHGARVGTEEHPPVRMHPSALMQLGVIIGP